MTTCNACQLCGCAEPEEGAVGSKGEDKPSKAKKQKQRGCYAPQRLLTAVCKVAPHFKVAC